MNDKNKGDCGDNYSDISVQVMPTVGVIGAGQLARMLAQSAISLNVDMRILALSLEEPAAQIVPDTILSTRDDLTDLRELARGVSAITCENEGANRDVLSQLLKHGVKIHPSPTSLAFVQDKLILREKLAELHVSQPEFAAIDTFTDFMVFAQKWDFQIVLKARQGGYDGRGVWIFSDVKQCELAQKIIDDNSTIHVKFMVEQKINWSQELAIQIARSPFGQISSWPIVTTVQKAGQCAFVIAPAQDLSESMAENITLMGIELAQNLNVVGLLAVELFITADAKVFVNELAMRPHNSGHWTMDGAMTSQFEQHLRAILDYPLGVTTPLAPVTIMGNIIGAAVEPQMVLDERVHHLMARMPEAKIHLYGKTPKPDRKLGHINLLGHDTSHNGVAILLEKARLAVEWLSTAHWTDGWDEHYG